jgi:(heptosyl)LPS beta-1,4-glucosyltransferase
VRRLSVTIIAWNEEERLRACLESVGWADDVVVVDAESSDKTVQLAREFTDRVYVRPWPGFAVQKNFALDQATGEWILSLDADERVTAELAERIKAIVAADGPADGYLIPRRNLFWGTWVRHGGLYPDYQLRLFRRGAGRFVEDAVHESVRVTGRVEPLGQALLHESYRDLEDFVRRSNRYSTLAARDWLRRGRRVGVPGLIMKPFGRFFSMYVLRRGFLDGWRGLVLAVLYAEYVFLRMAKAWEARRAPSAGRGVISSPEPTRRERLLRPGRRSNQA